MTTVIMYKWPGRDPITGKLFTTRWLATEETIRTTYPDEVAVECSAPVLK